MNPRRSRLLAGFQDRCIQPLCHLSGYCFFNKAKLINCVRTGTRRTMTYILIAPVLPAPATLVCPIHRTSPLRDQCRFAPLFHFVDIYLPGICPSCTLCVSNFTPGEIVPTNRSTALDFHPWSRATSPIILRGGSIPDCNP